MKVYQHCEPPVFLKWSVPVMSGTLKGDNRVSNQAYYRRHNYGRPIYFKYSILSNPEVLNFSELVIADPKIDESTVQDRPESDEEFLKIYDKYILAEFQDHIENYDLRISSKLRMNSSFKGQGFSIYDFENREDVGNGFFQSSSKSFDTVSMEDIIIIDNFKKFEFSRKAYCVKQIDTNVSTCYFETKDHYTLPKISFKKTFINSNSEYYSMRNPLSYSAVGLELNEIVIR